MRETSTAARLCIFFGRIHGVFAALYWLLAYAVVLLTSQVRTAEAREREATTFLFGTTDVDQVVYLGDAAWLERATQRWTHELGVGSDEAFLVRTLDAALSASADEIDALLARDALTARLVHVRKLPPAPARAVELLDDRVVLIVHDKAVLDEEDIANASLIVYGQSPEATFRRFGRRAFLTPGPLAGRRVAVLESADDGVSASLYDLSGQPILREALAVGTTKLTVAG